MKNWEYKFKKFDKNLCDTCIHYKNCEVRKYETRSTEKVRFCIYYRKNKKLSDGRMARPNLAQ